MAIRYESEEDIVLDQLIKQIGREIEPLARMWWGPQVYPIMLDPKALMIHGMCLATGYEMRVGSRFVTLRWASHSKGLVNTQSATHNLYHPSIGGIRAHLNNSRISDSLMRMAGRNMLEEEMEGNENRWFGIAKLCHPRIRDYLRKVEYNLMLGKPIHFTDLPGDYMDEFVIGILDLEDPAWKQFCIRMLQESIPQETFLRQVDRRSPWDRERGTVHGNTMETTVW
jgi:hypothetical protein